MNTTETKTRPILFSSEMVRAILAGRKTMTRRVVKPHPEFLRRLNTWVTARGQLAGELRYSWSDGESPSDRFVLECSPYGIPGDRLWVRETWAEPASLCGVWCVAYKADETARATMMTDGGEGDPVGLGDTVKPYIEHGVRWKASIHMPRWASRITIEVTDVKVERVQDINDADALAEGVSATHVSGPRFEFAALWIAINGPESWDANPWVWVVSFKRVNP